MTLATWVLIVWAYKGGITMHDFNSEAACRTALEKSIATAQANWLTLQGECVEK